MKSITSIADLEALPIWIVFDQVPQPGGKKPKKIPYTPGTQRKARVNDPSTCRPYAEAMADAKRTGRAPGFRLPPGLTLIDKDGELDLALIADVDSLSERSTNGGTHIIVQGEPPAGFVTHPGIEVYPGRGGRFVLLTRDIIDGRDTIEDRTDFLAKLFPPRPMAQPTTPSVDLTADHQTIIDRTLRTAKGRQLHGDGDIRGYPSRSEAVLALLNVYVSAGATPDQVDALIRASALYPICQDRWDNARLRKHDIDKAFDGTVVPWEGWNHPAPAVIAMEPHRLKNGAVLRNPQDAGTGDDCAEIRDELAALRAEKAALLQHLAERDAQLEATRTRAEKAESELVTLQLLQSATMTMLRSKTMRPGEKVLGLVSLFDAEAARRRGAVDAEGWSNAPLGRLADAGGCSPDTAGRHLTTVASTGIIETRTITTRDPSTGEIRKRRQIRLPTPADSASAGDLVERITMLSQAIPARDPSDQGWGGKRVCPDCGDVGTVTVTTVACAGCGTVLSTTKTTQAPADTTQASPYPHLAGTTHGRGYSGTPYPQVAASGREQRREWAAADLELREPAWLRDAPDPWDASPQPMLFVVADALQGSSQWAGD